MDNGDNNTEDGEMHITLQKREKGKTWSSPIQGQGILDPYAADQEQKRLMLQRFQEEVYSLNFLYYSLRPKKQVILESLWQINRKVKCPCLPLFVSHIWY